MVALDSVFRVSTPLAGTGPAPTKKNPTPDTNVRPNLQENHAGHAAHEVINLTYTHVHTRCTAMRGPVWSSWCVWSLPFGNQIGMRAGPRSRFWERGRNACEHHLWECVHLLCPPLNRYQEAGLARLCRGDPATMLSKLKDELALHRHTLIIGLLSGLTLLLPLCQAQT